MVQFGYKEARVFSFRSGAGRTVIFDNMYLRRIETSLGCRPSDEWISAPAEARTGSYVFV
ncbi:hypothetical protein J1614_008958 [Plenodomus biglobosus]|nr:hypothetical protein J1614_008958 [Plenodomus biglobosus]